MFNATGDAGGSSDAGAITYNDYTRPASFVPRLSTGVCSLGVDLRSLPIGTKVIVDTRNSRYRLVMRDDSCHVAVEGGRHFRKETEVRVDGSTDRGSILKIGWICVGLSLEFSMPGKRIVTSRVRSISVESFRP